MSERVELETAALWYGLPDEVRSYAWRLMVTRKSYEALRVLGRATGSNPRARELVAWLAAMIVKGEQQ